MIQIVEYFTRMFISITGKNKLNRLLDSIIRCSTEVNSVGGHQVLLAEIRSVMSVLSAINFQFFKVL